MRRAALERPRTLRVWRDHNRFIHDNDPTGCTCDEQPGRFRKGQRIGGCGKSRCWLCKRHKLTKEVTFRDYRAAFSYRESAAEWGFFVALPRNS